MSLPSDVEIVDQIRVIIERAFDNDAVAEHTKRLVRSMLNDHFGVDLESKKKFINSAIQDQVNLVAARRQSASAVASSSRASSPAKSSTATSKSKSKPRASSASARSKFASAPKRKLATSDSDDEAEPTEVPGNDSDVSDAQDSDPNDFSELEEDVSTSRSRKKAKPAQSESSAASRRSKAKPRASSGGSEAEQRLVRLKKLVGECGVRKAWKKLYEAAGVDESDFARQCTVVQGVLRELGMTGKGSVEQARKIRAEREFNDELEALQGNTVLASNRSRPTRASRSKTTATIVIDDDDGNNDEEDESDFDDAPSRRGNAKSSNRAQQDVSEDSEDQGPTRSRSFKSSLASFAADLNSDSD